MKHCKSVREKNEETVRKTAMQMLRSVKKEGETVLQAPETHLQLLEKSMVLQVVPLQLVESHIRAGTQIVAQEHSMP